jgi:putative flippase GtrA
VFALIGILSTLAYGVLYVALRGRLGAQEANALALAATAIANTAANRRFTFGFRGPQGALRHQLQGLLVFACGLGVTSGALWTLRAVRGDGHPLVEVVLLTAANLFVTVMRFVLMRVWIFRGVRAEVETAA